jgi:hypothetical protein
MAALTLSPPHKEKRRQKLPPWLRSRFYVRWNKGSASDEKTKHATVGVFYLPHTGSTLLGMRDTPAPNLARLKRLFPDLTEAEYASLDAWYAGYAALILRMYERITNDPAAYAEFLALTNRPSRPSMTGKVDSPKQTEHS